MPIKTVVLYFEIARKMKNDIEEIRKDFPILHQKVNNRPLVYLDNGATTQKPQVVIDAITDYYTRINSNVHRGVHHLSQVATDAVEATRKKVQTFINAKHEHEVIFTKGTTDSINLLAHSFGKAFVHEGDEVLISQMEHHSNIVPWQLLCEEKKAVLKVIPMTEKGELDMTAFDNLLSDKTKIVSVTYVSNALGTINPVEEIIQKAHERNIPVFLDVAQAIQHIPIDVQALNVDFIGFSGHKMYGPTGIGVLYGKENLLNQMPPYQGGGDMIKEVKLEKSTFNDLPFKFEAGTPHIAGEAALGAAIDYLQALGLEKIQKYEDDLLAYATEALLKIDGLKIYGTPSHKSSAISFLIDGLHPYDVGVILDKLGIAVRTGHHCAQPIMDFYGIPGTIRATFSFYNTYKEVDALVEGIEKAISMLK